MCNCGQSAPPPPPPPPPIRSAHPEETATVETPELVSDEA